MNKTNRLYKQELLRSQLEIQEETLRFISQEIHDNIGQVLSLAKLNLNTLVLSLQDGNKEAIDNSKLLVGKAINDLRGLSKSLHPDRVNELGLEENIRHELEILENAKKHTTSLQVKGSVYPIPVQMQTILFRMAQEAICNISKHAEANEVTILMEYEHNQFCIFITDNGVELNTAKLANKQTGSGLKKIQYRCKIIGATFSVSAAINGGTTIKICLPKHKINED